MEEILEPQKFDVTPELFKEWREPRLGNANPQKLKSKVWEWLLHSRLSGYASAKLMLGEPPQSGGPTWSFDRFGQSVTELPDGRTVYIGGEHEDFYDPDFYIYNDVVVTYPNGTVDFYCYPKLNFPPTDFHSATLVDAKIIIIGGLGFKEERIPGFTQLYVLDLETFKVQKLEGSGTPPGWIHGHTASLSEDRHTILVTKGKIHIGKGQVMKENLDDWKLTIDEWYWEKLAARDWTQFEIRREDQGNLHLFLIRTTLWYLRCNMEDEYQDMLSNLTEFLGFQPDVKRIQDLYNFDMEHGEVQNDEGAYNVFYFDVDGVRVRFTEEQYNLQVVIDGTLSLEQVSLIEMQLLEKLSTLLDTPCEVEGY